MAQAKTVIGRGVLASFPTLDIANVAAKIDTGADVSSIWCSQTEVVGKELQCIFFDKSSPHYTGKVHSFPRKDYTVTRIGNSFGQREIRYKLKLPMIIEGRRINATFTLADRSQKLYPVLLGNKSLRGKFLVDPSVGGPLAKEEAARQKRLDKIMANYMRENDI